MCYVNIKSVEALVEHNCQAKGVMYSCSVFNNTVKHLYNDVMIERTERRLSI